MIESVGWLATAVFVSSYFLRRPRALAFVQMGGAALWILYGVLSSAAPVIVANVLVAGAALLAALDGPRERAEHDRGTR